MSECTGLFPHELDPKNCSICRAAATQEDLLKMEREADVDFLFADTPERFISSQVSGTKFENCVLKQKWWTKLWLKIKNLMR